MYVLSFFYVQILDFKNRVINVTESLLICKLNLNLCGTIGKWGFDIREFFM